MQGNRQNGYGGEPWMCARLYLVPHQGVGHFTIDYIHPFTNKARTAKVMLARASTTSLTCSQSPKLLPDTRADSKHDGQLPKRGLQTPRMNTTHEKYGATQLDVEMLYSPTRSVTNDCARCKHNELGRHSMRARAGATSRTAQTDL